MKWRFYFSTTTTITLFFVGTLFSFFELSAQTTCPGTFNPGPGYNAANYNNVVINEISGDAGQSDSRNDAIVELAGPVGTDIGGMVITNGEWAIILPEGTMIPADGVFIIACSENPSEGSISTSTSGLTCPDCDFPGMPLDFDVCDDANKIYVSSSISTYGFTLDNGSCGESADGDQVLLFRPDGTPHDGIYWGLPRTTSGGLTTLGGSNGTCGGDADHISVQDGSTYTLGDNDENGVVNDLINSHLGRKSNGGNAIGVKEMPLGDYDPDGNGMTNAEEICFTMPGLSDPIWYHAVTAPTSCNSVFMRIQGSNGSHGVGNSAANPSHMDDPDLDDDWAAFAPGTATPTSIDPSGASMQWGYSDHPNPGEPNDADSWDFFVNGVEITSKDFIRLPVCNANDVTFEVHVYNYQQVEPTVMSEQTNYTESINNMKDGSRVIENGSPPNPWTLLQTGSDQAITHTGSSSNDGVTILQYMASPNIGVNNYTLVWDDFTDCCGSTVGALSNECYESLNVEILIVEPVTVSTNTVSCPGDFDAGVGIIDFSAFVTSPNSSQQFILVDNSTPVDTTSSGVFQLSTGLNGPITVIVEDLAGCGANQTIAVGLDCRAAPPCPEITMSSMDDTDGVICPGDTVCFSIDEFSMLAAGGTIDYYFDTLPTFNPYIGEGTLLGSADINTVMITNNPPPTVVINEVLVDVTGTEGNSNEFVELFNRGPGTIDISCWIITDGDDNSSDYVHRVPSGTMLAEGDFYTFAESCGSGCHTNSNEQVAVFEDDGTFVDGWIWGTGQSFSGGVNTATAAAGGGCAAQAVSIVQADLTSTAANPDELELDAAGAIVRTGIGGSTIGANNPSQISTISPTMIDTTEVDTFYHIFDYAFCNLSNNGQFTVKATINPFIEFSTPTSCLYTDPERSASFSMTMTCPEVTLASSDVDQCVGDGPVFLAVNPMNGTGPYTVYYSIDNVPQTPETGLTAAIDSFQLFDGNSAVDVTVQIDSVQDESGSMCVGLGVGTPIQIKISDLPSAELTAAMDLTDCDLTNDPTGAGTAEITFGGTGPYEFEYQINGGAAIQGSAVGTGNIVIPFTGDVMLLNVTNEAGCTGTINGSAVTINNPSGITVATATSPSETFCNDGSATIDLTQVITFAPVYSSASYTFYTADPTGASVLERTLTQLADPTTYPIMNGATAETLFLLYTDSGCEQVLEVVITASEGGCDIDCPSGNCFGVRVEINSNN